MSTEKALQSDLIRDVHQEVVTSNPWVDLSSPSVLGINILHTISTVGAAFKDAALRDYSTQLNPLDLLLSLGQVWRSTHLTATQDKPSSNNKFSCLLNLLPTHLSGLLLLSLQLLCLWRPVSDFIPDVLKISNQHMQII